MGTDPDVNGDLQDLVGIDRVVHEPARLLILMVLYGLESADFVFLINMTGLTWGNLSSHLSRLEESGYVEIEKEFVGKRPRTLVSLTPAGRDAVLKYRQTMQGALKSLD